MVSESEWIDYIQEDPRRPHFRDRAPNAVSIFRVPKFQKDTKREDYVPQRVSLGPYHRESPELIPMRHHKGRAVRRMMARYHGNWPLPLIQTIAPPVDSNNMDMDFADRARAEILQLENEIRDRYEENIDCDRDTLARMLCLDGCFLLEVLRALVSEEHSIGNEENCYDPIFGKGKLYHVASDIVHDILMLENQIPFLVLSKLLRLELKWDVEADKSVFDLLVGGISRLRIPFGNIYFDEAQWSSGLPHHLLDFLHTVMTSCPSSSQGERVDQGESCIFIRYCCRRLCIIHSKRKARNDAERILIPHAVELRNAGIKFSPLEGGCIKQIKFDENSATIFLPPIFITDITEVVFRNLIAYEMCKSSDINYVTCYVTLMKGLIDSEQDVALLRRMSLLTNWLGSDQEVVDLFNGLGKGVTVHEEDVFENLTEKVKAHYNNEMKVQIGKLVQDHFSSPWKALGLTVAIVILLLTVVQTIFTII